jgi:hypothetical protein
MLGIISQIITTNLADALQKFEGSFVSNNTHLQASFAPPIEIACVCILDFFLTKIYILETNLYIGNQLLSLMVLVFLFSRVYYGFTPL